VIYICEDKGHPDGGLGAQLSDRLKAALLVLEAEM
jgi:hypothetical protein